MNVCGEDQPAASQTSWRATPDIRALEAISYNISYSWSSGTGQPKGKVDRPTHKQVRWPRPPTCSSFALDAEDPCKQVQNIQKTVHFYTTGQLCGRKHLMPALGKANCAFPGPHSESRRPEGLQHLSLKVPQRKTRYQGVFANDIPPKGMW